MRMRVCGADEVTLFFDKLFIQNQVIHSGQSHKFCLGPCQNVENVTYWPPPFFVILD